MALTERKHVSYSSDSNLCPVRNDNVAPCRQARPGRDAARPEAVEGQLPLCHQLAVRRSRRAGTKLQEGAQRLQSVPLRCRQETGEEAILFIKRSDGCGQCRQTGTDQSQEDEAGVHQRFMRFLLSSTIIFTC